MTLKYESEILFDLMKRDGDDTPSDVLPYESELKEKYLKQVEGAYPKLQDYRSEWLNYNLLAHLPADFPVETLSNVTEATVDNVVPYAYGSAILKGNTKYHDIDTGDILDTFDETKNLELVSVKLPVLTTTTYEPYKSSILTVNEPVELRGIGEVQDTLDLMTGEVTERIGEIVLNGSEGWNEFASGRYYLSNILNNVNRSGQTDINLKCDKLKPISYSEEYYGALGISLFNQTNYDFIIRTDIQTLKEFKQWLSNNPTTVQYQLATESVKTVNLTVTDQDGNTESIIRPIEGTMHLSTSGETIKPTFSGEIPVEAITQNLASFIEE